MPEAISAVKAIKTYFEQKDRISPGGGRKVTMDELKGLDSTERQAVGRMAAEALGMEIRSAG